MKTTSIVILIAILATVGCSGDKQTELTSTAASLARMVANGEDHVTASELSDWLIKDRRDFELIDIRDLEEYSMGHIEGARRIPLASLLADASLASLPAGRRIIVYSNGSAHAAQGALLLRLTGRDALALLGGYNYWQAYLNDPVEAGVAEMDPAQRARYQAVSCFFEGDYIAAAGLVPSHSTPVSSPAQVEQGTTDALGLGLGLGLGSGEVQAMELPGPAQAPGGGMADELGLGLGLGGDVAKDLGIPANQKKGMTRKKLLIKAEC